MPMRTSNDLSGLIGLAFEPTALFFIPPEVYPPLVWRILPSLPQGMAKPLGDGLRHCKKNRGWVELRKS